MTALPHGAIAAGHALTVEAGLEMYRLKGNAFDAAVAAMLASWVTEPALTSAGGGGFCLAYPHRGTPVLLDFFTHTPASKRPTSDIDFYPVVVDFGGVEQEFHVGLGSIAVPGSLDGAVFADGALSKREKALIALAVSHAVQCPYCIDAYSKESLQQGADLEEMTEAVHVATAIRGGASLIHGLQMLDRVNQLSM